jgi:benzoyl-CoA reductase/2-hydroxyglutaryl-CoA dehydratase subunit BcrC/BadD/HgdB
MIPDDTGTACVPAADAVARLVWHYGNPQAAARRAHEAGLPVVGVTSNTAPWELVRAAGCMPVLVTGAATAADIADRFMEPVFDTRIRRLFGSILAGEWAFLRILVVPRTSEGEHKLYLYLREVVRVGEGTQVPPLWLYDLLHTRSARTRAYGRARTVDLAARLAQLTERPITDTDLNAAIAESDAARGAIRRLLRLRRGSAPRLSGAEALALVGAWHFMDRVEYGRLAAAAYETAARRPALTGPRLMISGASCDDVNLHAAIESHGAVVVAEDDWRGSRSAGRDIGAGDNPLARVFRKYYENSPSPRVFPQSLADRWFLRESLRGIEGVVHYLPREDDVHGWQYPRRRQFLDAHGIPGLVIHEDAAGKGLSGDAHGRIHEFVQGLTRMRTAV